MSRIDQKTLEKVAALAHLKLSREELQQFEAELGEVLKAFEQLKKVDVKGEEAQFQPVALQNQWRDDVPGKCLSQEQALANTRHKEQGYFKGPKVVE